MVQVCFPHRVKVSLWTNLNNRKQETTQHHKAKKFNLWTSLEHVFTLTVSTLPFTSSSKSEAESCEMDGLSLTAALPEEQKQKSHLYL